MKKRRLHIKTMGCQMNVYDSALMERLLDGEGYESAPEPEGADVIVVNTCAIREKAEHKVYSYVGRLAPLKEDNPGLVIAVGGCVAQAQGQAIIEKLPHVDIVFGTHAAGRLPENIGRVRSGLGPVVDTKMDPVCRFEGMDRAGGRNRPDGPVAYVTIMQGCDNYCTYCVVPYTRGRETSRKLDDVVREVEALAGEGVREVTLLGQNVNSYGKKEGADSFVALLSAVGSVPGIDRVRYVTSHPRDLTDDIIRAFGEIGNLCGHLHLPVQSGSDRILKKMNRGYTRDQYMEKIARLREILPDIGLTTDFIVGFPGETEADFADTLDLAERVEFDSVYPFKYSDRPLAPAAKFREKVPEAEKTRRITRLIDLCNRITREKHRNFQGRTVSVLVEGASRSAGGQVTGRAWDNKIVNFDAPPDIAPEELIGRTVPVLIEQGFSHSLLGRMVSGEERKEAIHAA